MEKYALFNVFGTVRLSRKSVFGRATAFKLGTKDPAGVIFVEEFTTPLMEIPEDETVLFQFAAHVENGKGAVVTENLTPRGDRPDLSGNKVVKKMIARLIKEF